MDYAISHHTVFMPAGEYIRKYRDEDKFIVFCRRCNRYDRCWACPPYDFDISARIGKYKYICITGTQIVPDPSSVPTIPAGTEKRNIRVVWLVTQGLVTFALTIRVPVSPVSLAVILIWSVIPWNLSVSISAVRLKNYFIFHWYGVMGWNFPNIWC